MTTFAKFLIALLTATAVSANLVARAHGWSHVDWVPIATAYSGAIAIFAYPNTAPPNA